MSKPQPPPLAKLIVGTITAERTLFAPVARQLAARLGPIEIVSPWMAFDYTRYYAPEMGEPLFRRMLVFEGLIVQSELTAVKSTTYELEMQYGHGGRRRVNIDPGYLSLERLVLATYKNFSHRIYLGQSTYADLTLVYRKGGFQKLPWTFPDYAAAEMQAFLERVRRKCRVDLTARRKADLRGPRGQGA